ncbi:VVA0879 family protein [Streptomyces subrutilus]|uniref:Uncharacterized protein n=1 Tax=Streptomyces subrutilus TaxID=36818 RepID=A0A1E5NXT2_9ACTN|nr:VVA0879 family protein [Streptomyces subrutilus]OEJ20932.1 hypothetical protein BGK67_35445 [Streptomyces subrutilus]
MPKRNRKVQRVASRRRRESGNNLSYTAARAEIRVPVPPAGSVLDEVHWRSLGLQLFGTDDWTRWRVVCSGCGYIQGPAEFAALEREEVRPEFAFSDCVGRYLKGYEDDAPGAFPCNTVTWGFIPMGHYRVNWTAGKQGQVFRFAAPGERIEDNRRKHEARTRQWAAEAAAAAEVENARLREEDEAADRNIDEFAARCVSCDRAETRLHRRSCVWRTPNGPADEHNLASETVLGVHTEYPVRKVIARVLDMGEAAEEYERAVVTALGSLGLVIENTEHSSRADAQEARIHIWLPRASKEAPLHSVGWSSYFGWQYSDGVLGTPLKYRGGEHFEPLAVIVAAEIRKLADDGSTIWKSPHQWRNTLSADDWTAVVEGLQGAARALVMGD